MNPASPVRSIDAIPTMLQRNRWKDNIKMGIMVIWIVVNPITVDGNKFCMNRERENPVSFNFSVGNPV